MITSIDQLLEHHRPALAQFYHEDISLLNSLRSSIWRNSLHCAEAEHGITPEPMLVHWSGMDSRDRYETHIRNPASLKMLAAGGWVDSVIDYHINSWGFRSEREYEHIHNPCIVTLGCSYTYGTGLHEHQIWPSILAQRLGVELVNLGMPGHGLDLNSLWLLLQGYHITCPVAVCVFEPPRGRISWLARHNDTAVIAEAMIDIAPTDIQLVDGLLLNSSVNTVKNYSIIKGWAESRDVPMLWCNDLSSNAGPWARDLAHFGPEWHQKKADSFYNHLKNT